MWLVGTHEEDDNSAPGMVTPEGAESSSADESSLHTSLLKFSTMLAPQDSAQKHSGLFEEASSKSLDEFDQQEDFSMFL
jgi:hypothetical protein